jgi:hypothetical protein
VSVSNKSNATQRKIHKFETDNALAAWIILGDPARYPGLMQQWAEMVTARQKKSAGPAPEESQAIAMRKAS